MKEKTGEMLTLAAAASELGRRGNQPHKSQKLIYKIYIFAQFSKLELVQIYCSVKHFNGSAIFTRSK